MSKPVMTITAADFRQADQIFGVLAAYLQAGIGTPGIRTALQRALYQTQGDITLPAPGKTVALPRAAALILWEVLEGVVGQPEWLPFTLDLLNIVLPPLARRKPVHFAATRSMSVGTTNVDIGQLTQTFAFSPGGGEPLFGRNVSPLAGGGLPVFYLPITLAMVLHLIGACRDERGFEQIMNSGGGTIVLR